MLLATQELEKFAIGYGRIHNKADESKVVSEELFGKFSRSYNKIQQLTIRHDVL